jgi:hypothetical protein
MGGDKGNASGRTTTPPAMMAHAQDGQGGKNEMELNKMGFGKEGINSYYMLILESRLSKSVVGK